MATNEQSAVETAYTGAASQMGRMKAEIAQNLQADFRDHSVIVESSRSPFSILYSWIAWGDIPSTKFNMQDPAWHSYFTVTAIPAMMVLAAGILISLVLLCNLFGRPKARPGPRPTTIHLKWTMCSGFFLLWVCVGLAAGRGTYAYSLIYDSVLELQPDVNFIVGTIGDLQPRFHNAEVWLEGWETSCAGWSLLKPALGKQIEAVNNDYISQVAKAAKELYHLQQKTNTIPGVIENVKLWLHWIIMEYKVLIAILIFLPTILASILCFFIYHVTINESKDPQMARITNFLLLDLGAVPIVTVILLMTVVSAACMFLGTAIGGFCAHPQYNTVNLMSSMQEGHQAITSNMTTIVGYYVQGVPTENMIVENLRKIEGILTPVSEFMWIIAPALDVLGVFCKRIGSADITGLLETAVPDIAHILPLAKRDRVYGHYDDIVVRGVCGQLEGAIGWYMLCQIVSGMFLLPIIAMEAHRYLTKVVEEEALAKKANFEREALLTTQMEENLKELDKKSFGFFACGCNDARGRQVAVA